MTWVTGSSGGLRIQRCAGWRAAAARCGSQKEAQSARIDPRHPHDAEARRRIAQGWVALLGDQGPDRGAAAAVGVAGGDEEWRAALRAGVRCEAHPPDPAPLPSLSGLALSRGQ